MAVYAAQIDRMDQGIGKILDKLREAGAEENTLVMFLADNGGCAEEIDIPKGTPRNTWGDPDAASGSRHIIRQLRPAVGQCQQHAIPALQALGA